MSRVFARSLCSPLLAAAFSAVLADAVAAQCGVDWQAGAPTPGPMGALHAAAQLPNGDLLVGGWFEFAGGVQAHGLARFDGNTWSALGSAGSTVRDMITLANGDVALTGTFQDLGGVAVARIARFDGTTFHPYGAGFSLYPDRLLELANGDLLGGGGAMVSGGQVIHGVARWNGQAWSTFDPAILSGAVTAMAQLSNGDLVFAGITVAQGSGFLPPVLRYDGTSYTPIPDLGDTSVVTDILPLDLGQFVLCGQLQLTTGPASVALCNGTSTVNLVAPAYTTGPLARDAQGHLLAGGIDAVLELGQLRRFDGTQWTTLPASAPRTVTTVLPLANGELLVGGNNGLADPFEFATVRRFDGASWHDLVAAPPLVKATCTLANGDLIAGGDFTMIDGVAAANVARFDGNGWHALGSGVAGTVSCVAGNALGQVVVGGNSAIGGGGHVALWNGTAWSSLGAGLAAAPNRVAIDDQGRVMAQTATAVHLFDGLNWQTLPQLNGGADAMLADGNGGFLLAGRFVLPGATLPVGVVRYSGGSFAAEPTGVAMAHDMIRMRDGSIVVASASGATPLVRFANGTWSPLPLSTPFLQCIAELANGELCGIANQFPHPLLRVDGSGTTVLGTVQLPPYADGRFGIATMRNGQVFATHDRGVAAVDGIVSAGIARAIPECPAAAATIGTGCVGAGGAVTMAATDLPWLGSTFHAEVTGMAVPTIGLHLAGVAPLSLALPFGAPGCTLQVDPVLIGAFVPSTAQSPVAFAVPNAPVLVAQQLLTQVVALELDALGAITRTTSSNALQLTVGAF